MCLSCQERGNSSRLQNVMLRVLHLENGLLLLLDPSTVVPADPSWGLSLSQLAGGSFKSVFSCSSAYVVGGGAAEYLTTALLFTSLAPGHTSDSSKMQEDSSHY